MPITGRGLYIVQDDRGERQLPTITCCHCGKVMLAKTAGGGWCWRHSAFVCTNKECHDCTGRLRY